jgi:cobalt-zinc-cadmium efflux system protein
MSAHEHAHGGGHDGHAHFVAAGESDARRIRIALALIVGLMAAEVAAGVLAHSLALLSDAAHMVTDAGALVLALVTIRLVARPGSGNLTFGLARAEILSAQANGFTLLVLAGLIVYGAIGRIVSPPEVDGLVVLVVALAGAAVNLLATWQLSQANRASMNVEGAFQHLVTDLFAFALTAVAGGIVLATGYGRADGIAALVIAAVMLRAAYRLLRDSARVLLEAAPGGMSVDEIGVALVSHPHVASVHDLHVWQIGSGFPALSAHVLVHAGDDCHAIRRELESMLDVRFGIEHTTLQVDHERARGLLSIGVSRSTE